MMLDPANDLLPPQSSPTNSSTSSSDLDTESTGSFFHDRSTTLGSLMGVSFPAITFRAAPSRSHSQNRCQIPPPTTDSTSSNTRGRKSKNSRKKRASAAAAAAAMVPMAMDGEQRRRWRRRRWKWWRLCRDDCERHPSSLGEYLEVERRFGDVAFFSRAAEELEGVGGRIDVQQNNDGMLFADGRVLPPREIGGAESSSSSSAAVPGGLCSFSVVSLSGICSGGGGWG